MAQNKLVAKNVKDDDCIFCKIINKKIHAKIEHNLTNFIVIKDLHPKAKKHLLIIPKKHLILNKLTKNQSEILSEAFIIANNLRKKLKTKKGFRLIVNNGEDAGQAIEHLHIHFLAGQKLRF